MSSRLIPNITTNIKFENIVVSTATTYDPKNRDLMNPPIYQKLYKNIKITDSNILNFSALSLEHPKYFEKFFGKDVLLLDSTLPENLVDVFADILQELHTNADFTSILLKLKEYCNTRQQTIFILKFIIAVLISLPANQQLQYGIYIQSLQMSIINLDADYDATLEHKSIFF